VHWFGVELQSSGPMRGRARLGGFGFGFDSGCSARGEGLEGPRAKGVGDNQGALTLERSESKRRCERAGLSGGIPQGQSPRLQLENGIWRCYVSGMPGRKSGIYLR
jgi:hypothetical protein